MLPPVSGPTLPGKASPATGDTTQGSQSGPRTALAATPSERGPAKVKPETLRAIDPARQASASVGLRRDGQDGSDLSDTRPAGPPPAFVETLLERQARVAFDPPEVTVPFAEESAPAETPDFRARAGFAEARALATPPSSPEIDRKE